jgi:hypothetical protein
VACPKTQPRTAMEGGSDVERKAVDDEDDDELGAVLEAM